VDVEPQEFPPEASPQACTFGDVLSETLTLPDYGRVARQNEAAGAADAAAWVASAVLIWLR
jgi:hypothetical protein